MARPSAAQLRARREFVRRFGHRQRNPRAHRRRKLRKLRAFVLDRGPWAPGFYTTPGGSGRRGRRRIARAMPKRLRTTVVPAYGRRRARSNPGGISGGMLVMLGLGAFLLWSWSRSRASSANPVPMPAGGCPPGSMAIGITATDGGPSGIFCGPDAGVSYSGPIPLPIFTTFPAFTPTPEQPFLGIM